jgi:PAS domain S-box-containing protein
MATLGLQEIEERIDSVRSDTPSSDHGIVERDRIIDGLLERLCWADMILENAPINIQLKSINGDFIWANRAFAETFGRPVEEFVSAPVGAHLDGPFESPPIEHDRRPLRTGKFSTQEEVFEDRIFQVSKCPVFDTHDNVIAIAGFDADISDLKKAQNQLERQTAELEATITERTDALRQSEQRFRDYAMASSDWFWEMDENLRFTWFSADVENVVGVPAEWHYGKTREEIGIPSVSSEEWEEHLETLRQHEPYKDFTYCRHGPDGDKWLRSSGVPVFDFHGSFKGYRGTGSDISATVEAQRQIEYEQRLFKNAVESMSDGFALFDPEDCLVFCNAKFKALNTDLAPSIQPGMTFEEMLRDNIKHGRIVDAIGREESFIAERMERHQHPQGSHLSKRKDGLWLLLREQRTEEGFSFLVNTDLTEIKQHEEALIESQKQLFQAQKMEVVGQLTGGVAHDFNNLLGVVIGNLDFLKESFEGTEEQREFIASAQRAAMHGSELTGQLLAFSRKQALNPKVSDLNSVIDGMTKLLQRALGETIVIRTAPSVDLELVKIDQSQFETALLNLTVNSRQAMPKGGKLTIETTNVEVEREYADKNMDGETGRYVMVAVSDTGIGMSSTVLNQAIEPFFTTKEVGQGSGLGLSMVHGFAKQSGGHFSIYSEEGVGTTVKLYFPVTKENVVTVIEKSEKKTVPLGDGETVLIVEDDSGLRDLAIKTISSLGYKAVAAPDGKSALAVMDAGLRIDILFTDVVLPNGMNGVALAAEASVRQANLRILYTSGYTKNAILDSGVVDDGIELLGKPYRRAELARLLRDVLDGC